MNSRNLKKNAEERVRGLVQAHLTVDSDSDEEVSFNGRETRQGCVQIKPKMIEGAKAIEELKGLGMYEEGMSIDQVRAILQVIAESKETAATEENLRSKFDEWEDDAALETTLRETEPKTPDTITSVSSSQGMAGESSQELFNDVGTMHRSQALLDDTVPFCPSDDETMLCSPAFEANPPVDDMQIDNDSSSPRSGPASPTTPTKPASPLDKECSSQPVSETGDSETQDNHQTVTKKVKTIQERNQRRSLSLRSVSQAAVRVSMSAKGIQSQPSSDTDDSELMGNERAQVWNAKIRRKIATKQSNRPKHKVPYYRPDKEKEKNPKKYTNIIVQAFNDYFKLVASLQKTLRTQEEWGKPVQAGLHHKDTLDVKTTRGKVFSLKRYMSICKGENAQSPSETESEDDVSSKKDTSMAVNVADKKRPVLSPDPYDFEEKDSEDIAIDCSPNNSRSSPNNKIDSNAGVWLSTYKRQLKVDGKAKTELNSGGSGKCMPSNLQPTIKPSVKESAAKKRKLMVKAPRSYDSSDSVTTLEVITVPDDKLHHVGDKLESKGYETRQKRNNDSLRSSKRNCESDKQGLTVADLPNSEDGSKDQNNPSEERVACPLCERMYNQTQIKYHASKCQGKDGEAKSSSSDPKKSCHCYICKDWFALVHYQAHVKKCMAMRSSSPLSENEVTLLVGDKKDAVADKPTGSRLLDRLYPS